LFGFGGAALGSGIGYGLVVIFNTFGPGLFFIPITVNLVVGAILVAAITGVLAAVVPAERAARLDPVEAIRHA
jgi:lipoprotein-releasing system permease protein